MKLVIEIDSAELTKAVENQVAKEISAITSNVIAEKVNEVMSVKLSRVTDEKIDSEIHRVVSNAVHYLINGTSFYGKVDKAISQVTKDIVKDIINKQ